MFLCAPITYQKEIEIKAVNAAKYNACQGVLATSAGILEQSIGAIGTELE